MGRAHPPVAAFKVKAAIALPSPLAPHVREVVAVVDLASVRRVVRTRQRERLDSAALHHQHLLLLLLLLSSIKVLLGQELLLHERHLLLLLRNLLLHEQELLLLLMLLGRQQASLGALLRRWNHRFISSNAVCFVNHSVNQYLIII